MRTEGDPPMRADDRAAGPDSKPAGASNGPSSRPASKSSSPTEVLREGLALLKVPDAARTAALLDAYLAEIEKWNPRFGLVKATGEELVVKHVLDSLAGWRVISDLVGSVGTVVDLGSGAGFPGIPLAVALPSVGFTLMERSTKRSAFLRNCALLLGLSNIAVKEADLTTAKGSFDVVTLRAFAPLDRFLQDLAASGITYRAIVAYKGTSARVSEELALLAGAVNAEVIEVSVPFLEEERHLIVIHPLGV